MATHCSILAGRVPWTKRVHGVAESPSDTTVRLSLHFHGEHIRQQLYQQRRDVPHIIDKEAGAHGVSEPRLVLGKMTSVSVSRG